MTSKSQWLNTIKVFFLLIVYVHWGHQATSAPDRLPGSRLTKGPVLPSRAKGMWKIVQHCLKLLPGSDISVLLTFHGQSYPTTRPKRDDYFFATLLALTGEDEEMNTFSTGLLSKIPTINTF